MTRISSGIGDQVRITMQARVFLALLLCSLVGAMTRAQSVSVTIDPASPGRTFDGFGAVSAGASSRLLYDYPEPYRSQVLDYLFLPHYGASLQHLKVEIGSDVNSTDGSEPSHMRTPQDKNFTRGYEWWLMQEAHRRNPKIILDTLAWGAPGWVGLGGIEKATLYTPAMAHYAAVFLNGAQSQYHLNIPYTGIWNEKPFDAQYVKTLRGVLNNERPGTKIVCCDEYPHEGLGQWNILDAMRKDSTLAKAVDVVSVHYPREKGKLTTPADATSAGKRLWSSEDQPESSASIILSRDWPIGGRSLAHLYNENYLEGHFTKTEIWSPVTSYYDILAAPNSGLMYANTPWSGHYQVQGAIWATAHTTQFAEPGWRYLNNASGQLSSGSYVTLAAQNGHDWSMVVETINGRQPTNMTVAIKGSLAHSTLHVWETNQNRTFEHVGDITPHDGGFSYTFEPDSLYTITTTTGQHKGTAVPPPSKPFPFPYHESFEKTPLLRAPAYLSDQDGAYEVHSCRGKPGRCLEQVITQKPIPWGPLPDPWTLAGDVNWTDYREHTDFRLPANGVATLIGRIDSADVFADQKARYPSGYVLRVQADGHWALTATAYKESEKQLATGAVALDTARWHSMELTFRGSAIHAVIDGKAVADLEDHTHRRGMVGIGSGWDQTAFDNIDVEKAE
ncbi:MAG TPA: family 16 glycoside hydrolase [Acidobacteriaceae bacterium]|nr:family 16 glycoside hydrolase [Acidobacteriaceae bacterium]